MIYYASLALFGLGLGIASIFALPQDNTYVHDLEQSTQSVMGMKTEAKREIMGFQPFWLVNQADPDYHSYTTKLSYFGVGLNGDGTIQKFVNPGETEPGLQTLSKPSFRADLAAAREQGVTLSLVVHLMDKNTILELLTEPEEHAENMMEEVAPIMQDYGFTDLNIDIESVGYKPQETRDQFTAFVAAVRDEVQERELGTMGVDVIAKSLVEPQLTDVAALGPYVDYVVLMTYDFHYVGSYIAGPVAPLKGAGIKREYDVESTIQEALKVLPAEKVIMGIPLYGYEWDTITNVPGGPTVQGTGKVLTHKQVGSILEECEEEETCITGVDEDYLQPYIIKPANDGNGDYYRQIFYEDRESMKQKLDIADRYNIRGVALWALGYEQDDMTDELRSYKLRMRK
jgi:chitinase